MPSGDARMPPWLPRAFLLALAMVLMFGVGLWALLRLRDLFVLLLISLFVALAMEPAVNWLARRGWRRGVATGGACLVVLLLLAGFLALLGSLLAAQVSTLVRDLPSYVRKIVGGLNATFGTDLSQRDIYDKLSRLSGIIEGHLSDLAGNVWGIGTTAIGLLFQALAVALFTFYLSADGPRFRRSVCSLFAPERQGEVLRAWEITVDKAGGYLYSRALLALASSIVHMVGLWLLGVPFALSLGLWVGVISQFIPTVGTYLAGAVPVLVALVKSPVTALWVLLLIIAYQQVENYLLQPRITARTLDMHPAVAFGSVLAGAALIGPAGALLALPVGASIQTFVGAYLRRYEVQDHPLITKQPRRPRHRS